MKTSQAAAGGIIPRAAWPPLPAAITHQRRCASGARCLQKLRRAAMPTWAIPATARIAAAAKSKASPPGRLIAVAAPLSALSLEIAARAAAQRQLRGRESEAEMDEAAQRSGEPPDDALELAALALRVEDGVGHPPDPVGDEAERQRAEHDPPGPPLDPVERPAGILHPPQLQREIADDQIEQPARSKTNSGERREIGGNARHGGETSSSRPLFPVRIFRRQ